MIINIFTITIYISADFYGYFSCTKIKILTKKQWWRLSTKLKIEPSLRNKFHSFLSLNGKFQIPRKKKERNEGIKLYKESLKAAGKIWADSSAEIWPWLMSAGWRGPESTGNFSFGRTGGRYFQVRPFVCSSYLYECIRVRARKCGSKSYLGPWAFMATGPIEQVPRRFVYARVRGSIIPRRCV